MSRTRYTVGVLVVTVALGGLEAAWTGIGRGGPINVWLGVSAIFAALFVVTWPNWWFIPGLAIVEEWVHLIVGYGVWLPTENTLLHHWSIAYLGGLNIYPWLTFPMFTLIIALFSKWLAASDPRKP